MTTTYEDTNSIYTNRLDVRKNFFTQTVLNDWNRLTSYIVEASSIKAFKNRLDDFLTDMDDLKAPTYTSSSTTRKGGNYSSVLPLKAARLNSIWSFNYELQMNPMPFHLELPWAPR